MHSLLDEHPSMLNLNHSFMKKNKDKNFFYILVLAALPNIIQLCSRMFVPYLCCAPLYHVMGLQALFTNFTKHPGRRACKSVKAHGVFPKSLSL